MNFMLTGDRCLINGVLFLEEDYTDLIEGYQKYIIINIGSQIASGCNSELFPNRYWACGSLFSSYIMFCTREYCGIIGVICALRGDC
jgi:hypothetical protein